MTASRFGVLIAATLAIVWIFSNFGWMILVAVAMGVGWLVGAIVEGRVSLGALASVFQGKRSSS